jgi:hypothetical protein
MIIIFNVDLLFFTCWSSVGDCDFNFSLKRSKGAWAFLFLLGLVDDGKSESPSIVSILLLELGSSKVERKVRLLQEDRC